MLRDWRGVNCFDSMGIKGQLRSVKNGICVEKAKVETKAEDKEKRGLRPKWIN